MMKQQAALFPASTCDIFTGFAVHRGMGDKAHNEVEEESKEERLLSSGYQVHPVARKP